MENWHTCRYSVTIPGHGSHSQGWCRELLDQPLWCGFGGRLPWTRGHSVFWNRAWSEFHINLLICTLPTWWGGSLGDKNRDPKSREHDWHSPLLQDTGRQKNWKDIQGKNVLGVLVNFYHSNLYLDLNKLVGLPLAKVWNLWEDPSAQGWLERLKVIPSCKKW